MIDKPRYQLQEVTIYVLDKWIFFKKKKIIDKDIKTKIVIITFCKVEFLFYYEEI